MIPTAAWVARSPARVVAFGFGSGLLKPAPGTWGTLAAWIGYSLLLQPLSEPARVAIVALAFALGVWACGKTGRDLGVADHGGMVWDEVAAFWLVLVLVPVTWAAQTAAFFLFRLFDIFKPPPIRYFDRRLKNGFGVMFDDLLAAGYVLLVFALWERVMT